MRSRILENCRRHGRHKESLGGRGGGGRGMGYGHRDKQLSAEC